VALGQTAAGAPAFDVVSVEHRSRLASFPACDLGNHPEAADVRRELALGLLNVRIEQLVDVSSFVAFDVHALT